MLQHPSGVCRKGDGGTDLCQGDEAVDVLTQDAEPPPRVAVGEGRLGRHTGLRPGVSIPYREKIIQDVPMGHFGEPSDIAHAVAYLCSKEADFVTGSVLTVDGGSGAGRFHLPYSTTE